MEGFRVMMTVSINSLSSLSYILNGIFPTHTLTLFSSHSTNLGFSSSGMHTFCHILLELKNDEIYLSFVLRSYSSSEYSLEVSNSRSASNFFCFFFSFFILFYCLLRSFSASYYLYFSFSILSDYSSSRAGSGLGSSVMIYSLVSDILQ